MRGERKMQRSQVCGNAGKDRQLVRLTLVVVENLKRIKRKRKKIKKDGQELQLVSKKKKKKRRRKEKKNRRKSHQHEQVKSRVSSLDKSKTRRVSLLESF